MSNPEYTRQLDVEVREQVTAEEHARSSGHVQQNNYFGIYKKLYINHLSPLLAEIHQYLEEVEQDETYQCVRDEFAIALARLSSQADELKNLMNRTQSKKTWGETRKLIDLEQTLHTDFDELQNHASNVMEEAKKVMRGKDDQTGLIVSLQRLPH